jgi:hypothetical protein
VLKALFLAAFQHGVWHYNSEIPSLYIQLGVCGEFIIGKDLLPV